MHSTLFSFLLLVLINVGVVSGATINREISTVLDLTTSYVRLSADVKVSGADGAYVLSFPTSWGTHLSYLSAKVNEREMTIEALAPSANSSSFRVDVDEASFSLRVTAVFTDIFDMYPAEITQNENQLVRLKGSHFFVSPYHTETQKLVVKLPSSSIESFTKKAPFSMRGNSLHFGPYTNVEPFKSSPMELHFVHNYPFAKFSSMIREVEVSHWGVISVEEIYELRHVGAKLKGGFSRFDYQLKRGMPTSSLRTLSATLPSQASSIYYRDQIGNISTSDLKLTKQGNLNLEIQTRFPLFGGWQTQFYIGYSLPTELALFTSGDRFKLKLDFNTPFHGVWVDDMEFKVILPEGCSDIVVNSPYQVNTSTAVRYTFLDSSLNGGRPVVVLKTRNVVEDHSKSVEILYTFDRHRMLVEPVMVVVTFMLFFVALSVVARTTYISSRKSNGNVVAE